MPTKNIVKHSKFLSLLLRHQPETIGLSLDTGGWASVEELLAKLQAHGRTLSPAELDIIVSTNDKQRFSFNEDKTRIRANQGHSLKQVELGLAAIEPPPICITVLLAVLCKRLANKVLPANPASMCICPRIRTPLIRSEHATVYQSFCKLMLPVCSKMALFFIVQPMAFG